MRSGRSSIRCCRTRPGWASTVAVRRSIAAAQIVDAIFYLVDNGIKWRAMPVDFPPWSTVYNFFAAWAADGVTTDLLDMLRQRVRLAEGRTATPTAAVIDSQSVKAADRCGGPAAASTPGRRSTAANGTSPSTPSAC